VYIVTSKILHLNVADAVERLAEYKSGVEPVDHFCHFFAKILAEGLKSPTGVAMKLTQTFEIIELHDPREGNSLFRQDPMYYKRIKDEIPAIVRNVFPQGFAEEVIEVWLFKP
jgi:hypothetical protein